MSDKQRDDELCDHHQNDGENIEALQEDSEPIPADSEFALSDSGFSTILNERLEQEAIIQSDESELEGQQPNAARVSKRWKLPLLLFLATCGSTYLTGGVEFAFALLVTLLAHEFGHYLQAVRYGVPASYPFFIPMPLSPIGTMGAVIGMQPGRGDRRSLFDIAITGPIAGLLPALVFSFYGLSKSTIISVAETGSNLSLGEPLIFKAMVYLHFGSLAEGTDVLLHPIAFAGWVGIFITALNLFPIGQLDGGHILYSLLRERSHMFSKLILIGCIAGVVAFEYWGWTLMLSLLIWMGAKHPPTANDEAELGRGRIVLGWLALFFMPLGFTPMPFILE